MKKGARIIVPVFITTARGTSPSRSFCGMANAKAKQIRGAKTKLRTISTKKPLKSFKAIVKPIEAIIITTKRTENRFRSIPR